MRRAVHFIGFRDSAQVARAKAIFGAPDFWHRFWDMRAAGDIAPGDMVIFAKWDEKAPFADYVFDDSSVF